MKWRWPLIATVVGLALLTVLFKGFGADPHAVPFMLEGTPAPGFVLKDLATGEEVSLESLRGQPVVLNFWASWCGPCLQEHPVLEWGHRKFGNEARFLGVIFEDNEENARQFLAKNHSSFHQLVDPRGAMAVDYGVAGVPETYFIDPAGQIRGKHIGPISPRDLSARIDDLKRPAAPSGG